MKYCIIYNKNASSGRKSKFIKKISDELSKYNDVSFFETESVDKAEAVFKNISKLNIDRLVVAGGDGSVSFAINKLIKNNFNILKNDGFYNVRYQIKPFMIWIWISIILISLGGILSIVKKNG